MTTHCLKPPLSGWEDAFLSSVTSIETARSQATDRERERERERDV
jgi:hypothetical protein